MCFDLGYLGVDKDYPEQQSASPYKRKRNSQVIGRGRKKVKSISPK